MRNQKEMVDTWFEEIKRLVKSKGTDDSDVLTVLKTVNHKVLNKGADQ
jgi:hypothetical protein